MPRTRTSRRQFLTAALGVGGSIGLGAAARGTHGSESPDPAGNIAASATSDGLKAVTRASRALGCEVSLTVLHAQRDVAGRAAAAALAQLQLVEDLMSLYRPQSQLARLNRTRVFHDPHPWLTGVLRAAQTLSKKTDGAFDVTVQPLWNLYSAANRSGRVPEEAAVRAALGMVDWRRVEISRRRIRLHGEGTAITLNGIAQGFAADRVMAVLRRYGIRHALVNTGEIGTLGGKSDGQAWTAGIQHPRREDAYVELAKLDGRCLATSGDYATGFSGDHAYNHLFDPHTGRSPEAFASVSVVAATAIQADALSTAVFVLGLERGLQLVRSTPAADAMLVLKDGRTLSTEGFPAAV